MRVIAYTSERLAAFYCLPCATARWTPTERQNGQENTPAGHLLHPVFSTDGDIGPDDCCDDCLNRFCD